MAYYIIYALNQSERTDLISDLDDNRAYNNQVALSVFRRVRNACRKFKRVIYIVALSLRGGVGDGCVGECYMQSVADTKLIFAAIKR